MSPTYPRFGHSTCCARVRCIGGDCPWRDGPITYLRYEKPLTKVAMKATGPRAFRPNRSQFLTITDYITSLPQGYGRSKRRRLTPLR